MDEQQKLLERSLVNLENTAKGGDNASNNDGRHK